MHVVVLTGAGISAESGIPTFRGAGGLWEGYKIEDVASPEGWSKDFKTVLHFYNERRKAIKKAEPNAAHFALAELEKYHQVSVITQNIDDLHERAGSTNVLHLHGEIFKARSTKDPELIYPVKSDILPGDTCNLGSQLRPHIVWFGEEVPMMLAAAEIVETAEVLIIIGTSMVVYPAASLLYYSPPFAQIYVINPEMPEIYNSQRVNFIQKNATTGVTEVVKILKAQKN